MKFAYAIVAINVDIKIAVKHQSTQNLKEDAYVARAIARQVLTNVSGSYTHTAITAAAYAGFRKIFPTFNECVLVADNPMYRSGWCIKWENPK